MEDRQISSGLGAITERRSLLNLLNHWQSLERLRLGQQTHKLLLIRYRILSSTEMNTSGDLKNHQRYVGTNSATIELIRMELLLELNRG